jgi:hypothetical protein
MTDHPRVPPEPQEGEQPSSGQEGVFGRLPGTRPGVRSPRRRAGGQATEAEPAGAQPEPRSDPRSPEGAAAARVRPEPARDEAPTAAQAQPGGGGEPSDTEEQPGPQAEHGGVEELAWGGIAVAAEAATLGVRLLSRAMDAVRRPPDRR